MKNNHCFFCFLHLFCDWNCIYSNFTDQRKWKKKKDDDEYNPEDDLNDINESEGVPEAAKADSSKLAENATEDEFGAKDYRSQMEMKPDHASRALWVVSLFCNIYTALRIFKLYFCIFSFVGSQWNNLPRIFLAGIQTRARLFDSYSWASLSTRIHSRSNFLIV